MPSGGRGPAEPGETAGHFTFAKVSRRCGKKGRCADRSPRRNKRS